MKVSNIIHDHLHFSSVHLIIIIIIIIIIDRDLKSLRVIKNRSRLYNDGKKKKKKSEKNNVKMI